MAHAHQNNSNNGGRLGKRPKVLKNQRMMADNSTQQLYKNYSTQLKDEFY